MNKLIIIGNKKYIGRHFKQIEKYFGKSLVYSENYNVEYILSKKPDLVIVPDEHYCELGNLISILKLQNVLTLQLMDGILEWRRIWENSLNGFNVNGIRNPLNQPIFSDKIACLGYCDYKILESWGNYGKCEIVGMPRLSNIINLRTDFSHLKIKQNKILVCTAKTPAFSEIQYSKTLESLKDIKEYFSNRKDLEIVWRLTGDLHDKLELINTLNDLNGQEIQDIIQNVDAVITTPSTTLLEAMVLKTPVAILDYHNSPHYFQSSWSIYSKSNIENVVDELLNPPIPKLEYQDFLLNEQLFIKENPTERLIKLINGMLLYRNKINEIPKSILNNDYSISLKLKHDISAYYPDIEWVEKLSSKEIKLKLTAAYGTISILSNKLNFFENKLKKIPFYSILKKIFNI